MFRVTFGGIRLISWFQFYCGYKMRPWLSIRLTKELRPGV